MFETKAEREARQAAIDAELRRARKRDRADRKAWPFGCLGFAAGLLAPALLLVWAGEGHVIELPVTGFALTMASMVSMFAGGFWLNGLAKRFFESRDKGD